MSAVVGMVIFVFAIIVGCLLLLYLIAYAAFYARIYSKGKCRVDFIAYGAVAFGIATAFIVVMTVIFPKTFYGVLITLSLTFAVMVAYAVVAKKYTALVTVETNDTDKINIFCDYPDVRRFRQQKHSFYSS